MIMSVMQHRNTCLLKSYSRSYISVRVHVQESIIIMYMYVRIIMLSFLIEIWKS